MTILLAMHSEEARMYPALDLQGRLDSARLDQDRRLAAARRTRLLRLLARGDRVERIEP